MHDPSPMKNLRRSVMVTCLSAALGIVSQAAFAGAGKQPGDVSDADLRVVLPVYLRAAEARRPMVQPPKNLPMTSVNHCEDDDQPGSLRLAIAAAAPNDTIDLSGLACSRITLDSTTHMPAFIPITQDTLYLKGPGADQLVIDGNYTSGIFRHSGMGLLSISGVGIENGKYNGNPPVGACIASAGNVNLDHVALSHCSINNSYGGGLAKGGAVYAAGDVTLHDSALTRNYAFGTTASARGGAVYGKNITAVHTTISDNGAASQPGIGVGGGLFASGALFLQDSTVSANHADNVGGVSIAGAVASTVIESTISGNTASNAVGGIYSYYPLTVVNSTVAFNTDGTGVHGAGGIYTYYELTLQSSIVADNGEVDINGSSQASMTADSTSNLIGASALLIPAGTAQLGCPMLEPLIDSGGGIRTHRPRTASYALDNGKNLLNLPTDQRGLTRVAGADVDIGAVERQVGEQEDSIFFNGLDGFCSH